MENKTHKKDIMLKQSTNTTRNKNTSDINKDKIFQQIPQYATNQYSQGIQLSSLRRVSIYR